MTWETLMFELQDQPKERGCRKWEREFGVSEKGRKIKSRTGMVL